MKHSADSNLVAEKLAHLECESETDFYGLSFVLNACFQKIIPRPLKAHSFKHGWSPIRTTKFSKQIVMHEKKERLHFCFNTSEKNLLIQNGFQNVVPMGAPFLYATELTKDIQVRLIPGSFLIMPGHTLSHVGGNTAPDIFFQNSYRIAKEKGATEIATCLHRESINDDLLKSLEPMNIKVIKGAKHDRSISLLEQSLMYRKYEYMITNSIGSHVLYALHSGCKVKIIDTFIFTFDELMKHPWYRENQDIARSNIENARNMLSIYPEFNRDWINPEDIRQLINEEIGWAEYQKSLHHKSDQGIFSRSFLKILRWCFKNIKAYIYFRGYLKSLKPSSL